MFPSKILLIEDDGNLGYLLQENLELQGFEVTLCSDGEEGKTAFLRGTFQICLIDVMLPKKDGFTLAREIRELDKAVPIIFLTAKSLREDRIEGFKIGADDYITKPFSMEELCLRIQAVLKRSQAGQQAVSERKTFLIGEFEFDCEQQRLRRKGAEQTLTYKEAELLKLLCAHMNTVLERELALNLIWGEDTVFNARSMDVFITRLRKYLRADGRVQIANVHGKGFKLVVGES